VASSADADDIAMTALAVVAVVVLVVAAGPTAPPLTAALVAREAPAAADVTEGKASLPACAA